MKGSNRKVGKRGRTHATHPPPLHSTPCTRPAPPTNQMSTCPLPAYPPRPTHLPDVDLPKLLHGIVGKGPHLNGATAKRQVAGHRAGGKKRSVKVAAVAAVLVLLGRMGMPGATSAGMSWK